MFVRLFSVICISAALSAAPNVRKPGKALTGGVQTPGVRISFERLKPEAAIPLPAPPAGVIASPAGVFIAAGTTVTSVDIKENKPAAVVSVLEKPCAGIVDAFGTLVVADCGKQALVRVDAKEKAVKATVQSSLAPTAGGLAATDDSLWVLSDEQTTLTRIDPEQNRIVAEVRLPAGCTSVAYGERSLWVACPRDDRLLRIEPLTNLVKQRIEVKGQPFAVAAGAGAIWVLCKTDGVVARIDPKTDKIAATIELKVPNASGTIAVGEGSVWVGLPGFPIVRIDPADDKVVQQFAGEGGGLLYAGASSIWVGSPGQSALLRFDPRRVRATLAE